MRVAVTGSSGLIGTALTAQLTEVGHQPVAVVRGTPAAGEIGWDPAAGRIDATELAGIDAIVHLAGVGIADHRWTDDYKRQIHDSRTRGTALISEAVAAAGIGVLLSASGINFYGSGDEPVDESSPRGTGFLADVCRDWEASTGTAAAAGARVVLLRSGIVLSAQGGALRKQLPLFRLGLGGRFGNGRQWQSWISVHDHVRAITHLLGSELHGPVNLTAPTPVTNREFASTLGSVLHRPAVLPIPGFGPKLVLGSDLVDEILLAGQRVLPRALLDDGFEFDHPTLEVALRAILRR